MLFGEIVQYLTEIAQYLGLSASAVAIVFTLFKLLDNVASPAANRAVNAWIKRERYTQRDLKAAVVEAFDHLYGTPLLAVRTFFRVAGISLLSLGMYMWLARRMLQLHDGPWTLSDWTFLAELGFVRFYLLVFGQTLSQLKWYQSAPFDYARIGWRRSRNDRHFMFVDVSNRILPISNWLHQRPFSKELCRIN
jgi:hypothetical protein